MGLSGSTKKVKVFLFIWLTMFFQGYSALAASTTDNQNLMSSKEAKTVDIVDIAFLSVDDANKAVKTIPLDKPQRTIKCDVFIAGGGLGGVAAALKIWQLQSKQPLHVVLSEETDWLGGQATAQGVSALDENFLVETTGCTANYQTTEPCHSQ